MLFWIRNWPSWDEKCYRIFVPVSLNDSYILNFRDSKRNIQPSCAGVQLITNLKMLKFCDWMPSKTIPDPDPPSQIDKGSKKSVFRIHEIFVLVWMRIWIRGSIPLTNAIFVCDLQDVNKKIYIIFQR